MQPLVSLPTLGSRDHITPAMKELHWLPINQRITYKLCLMMHFIHTHQYPDHMRDHVSMTATTATRTWHRSASGLSYWKPRIRTKLGERAFSYSGPAAWNSLPIHLQKTTNTNTFKRLLKTYLFTTFMYQWLCNVYWTIVLEDTTFYCMYVSMYICMYAYYRFVFCTGRSRYVQLHGATGNRERARSIQHFQLDRYWASL